MYYLFLITKAREGDWDGKQVLKTVWLEADRFIDIRKANEKLEGRIICVA